MMPLHDIEEAVRGLSPNQLAKFRTWFAEYDAHRWDDQIKSDAAAGKLNSLVDRALEQHRAGNTRKL